MASQIQALESNNTWTIIHLSPRKKAVDYKWAFKSNDVLMDPLSIIRRVLLLKVTLNKKAGIIMIPLRLS